MGRLIGIVFLCLAVGIVLSFLGIDPVNLWQNGWGTVRQIGNLLLGFGEWALPYILVGAVIVVPIVCLSAILRLLRRRHR